MKKSIINLYLNETGKKALNTNVKVINVNEAKENITEEYIENMFPLSLVSKYEVKDSFLNLEPNDYVVVIKANGNRCLGKVGYIYRNQINVTVYEMDNLYPESMDFNATGIQATHCKNKAYLELGSEETIANLKRALENRPFVDILNMFNQTNENIKFDPEQIKLPEWLNINIITRIKELLTEAQDDYMLDHEEDNEINF